MCDVGWVLFEEESMVGLALLFEKSWETVLCIMQCMSEISIEIIILLWVTLSERKRRRRS